MSDGIQTEVLQATSFLLNSKDDVQCVLEPVYSSEKRTREEPAEGKDAHLVDVWDIPLFAFEAAFIRRWDESCALFL